MANTFASSVHKQVYDEGVQDELRDKLYFKEIADVRTETGEYIFARKGSDVPADMTTDGVLVASDFSYDKDSIGLTKEAYKLERITKMETTKQGFLIQEDRMNRHAEALARKINRDTALATLAGAGSTVTDGDLVTASNGGSTNPVIVTSTSADDLAAAATQKLQESNALDQMPYLMMRPKDAVRFGLFAMGTGNNIADEVVRRGYTRFTPAFGFDIFVTNDVPYTVTHTFGGNLTAADTFTVKGVTFTVRAVPAVAGEFDLGADTATTIINLANAINGSSTGLNSATGYFEVSAANRLILKNANITATYTATTLTITANAAITSAKSAAQITLGTETAVILAGARKSTVLRLPDAGYSSQVLEEVPLFSGVEVRATQIFDNGVWTKTAPKIVKIPVTV